jgi:hypothetical protein|tara:strand:+ start:1066 stop:1227 length:162 start_codon:yes stop_codon:yes gene_type:complete
VAGLTNDQKAAKIRRRIPIAIEQAKVAQKAFPEAKLGNIDAMPLMGPILPGIC